MKNKLFWILFLLIINCQTIHSVSFLGSGTAQDPYQIYTRDDLRELADSVLTASTTVRAKHFLLMNDITDPVKFCIGYLSVPARPFNGVFDGGGHSINLAIDSCPPESASALFLFASNFSGNNTVTIKNLTVNGYVKGYASAAGILFSTQATYTNIINCINNAEITAEFFASGIVTRLPSTNMHIEGCINLGTVRSLSDIPMIHAAGGIISESSTGNLTIINCINYGYVEAKLVAGGIMGRPSAGNSNNFIINCYNSGVVRAKRAGCIIGQTRSDFILINNHYDKQMCGEED